MKMLPKTLSRKGSVILTALGMGLVLMFIMLGVHTFTTNRIQTTIEISRKVKALALAEAGIEAVITEMGNTYGFVTHKVDASLKWSTAVNNTQTLTSDSNHSFSINSADKGTYSGSLGDGTFKVRLGLIPYNDNPDTKNIDESLRYFKVEAIGKYQDTYRKVEAIIDRRFPGREFLMYDGGVLSLIYGEPGKNNKNVFSTGHLYGHKGVEIGRIINSRHSPCALGTTQELDDMNKIISGAGGIFFYSPIQSNFRARKGLPGQSTLVPTNFSFPTNGDYPEGEEKYGEYPTEFNGVTPPIPSELEPWLADKHAGVSIPPKPVPFEKYKKLAKSRGIYISSANCNTQYPVTNGWSGTGSNKLKSKILDFGNNIHSGNVTIPANFNGIVYAEENLVIKGNPGVDIKIVSPKNIFVAGDFNQAGDPSKFEEYYGLNQDYPIGGSALESANYSDQVKAKLLDDKNSLGFRNHVAATVIAKERIVYDYRSPIDCFENELYPYMKYELAKAIANDAQAENNCLKLNRGGTITASATNEADFRKTVAGFIASFPIIDSAKEIEIADKLAAEYNSKNGKFNFDDFDSICKNVWNDYSESYEDQKCVLEGGASKGRFGVYKLLVSLRAKLGVPGNGTSTNFNVSDINDKSGDFLFFPEMTTNGMFISGGKQNNEYYAGPDYIKKYNEIGCSAVCIAPRVGIKHSSMMQMVHRVYGSESNLRLYDVHRIVGSSYSPPTRRKIYDTSLPTMGLSDSVIETAGYVLISWHDTTTNQLDYKAF